MDPSAQYAVIASREAWEDAGSPEIDPRAARRRDRHRHRRRLDPARPVGHPQGEGRAPGLPARRPDAHAQHLGAPRSRSSSAPAPARTPPCRPAPRARRRWATAYDMIRSGRADIVVAGGTEAAIHPLPIAGFAAMQALSTRNDDPERASRPYDTGRDGFVMGEGAAVIVLENVRARRGPRRPHLRRVRRRRACPPTPTTSPPPSPRAPVRRARCARPSSAPGSTDKDIVHINAHATSTPVGDVAEANAIRRAFGDDADDMCGQRHQVDDRSPARCRRRARGRALTILSVHHRLAPADHQPRRPRPRDRRSTSCAASPARCPTATSPRSTTPSASAATTSPWSSRASDARPPHRPRATRATRRRPRFLTGGVVAFAGA